LVRSLLFNIIYQDAEIAEEDGGDEEESRLLGRPSADGVHGWALFGTLLDRVCFVVTLLTYLFMFIRYFT